MNHALLRDEIIGLRDEAKRSMAAGDPQARFALAYFDAALELLAPSGPPNDQSDS